MSNVETQYWVLAYASDRGRAGWVQIKAQVMEPFPVTPAFWRHCTGLIQSQVPGSDLIALTPLSDPLERDI